MHARLVSGDYSAFHSGFIKPCNGFYTFKSQTVCEMFFLSCGSAWIHISCWLIRRNCALVVMTTHPHSHPHPCSRLFTIMRLMYM